MITWRFYFWYFRDRYCSLYSPQLCWGLNGRSVIAVGTLLNGSLTGLSIPVTARTRLMLVLSASASGLTLLNTVVGYASAGLGIT